MSSHRLHHMLCHRLPWEPRETPRRTWVASNAIPRYGNQSMRDRSMPHQCVANRHQQSNGQGIKNRRVVASPALAFAPPFPLAVRRQLRVDSIRVRLRFDFDSDSIPIRFEPDSILIRYRSVDSGRPPASCQ